MRVEEKAHKWILFGLELSGMKDGPLDFEYKLKDNINIQRNKAKKVINNVVNRWYLHNCLSSYVPT